MQNSQTSDLTQTVKQTSTQSANNPLKRQQNFDGQQDYLLHSSTISLGDTLRIDDQDYKPPEKVLKLDIHEKQNDMKSPAQPLQHTFTEYSSEGIQTINNDVHRIIHQFISSLPIDIPQELILFLNLGLQSSFMQRVHNYINEKHFFNIMDQLLHDSTEKFYSEYTKKTNNGLLTVLDWYKIFKQNPKLWKEHLNKRSSNFLPSCQGWTFVMPLYEKLEALINDYTSFILSGSDIFRETLLKIHKELLDPKTDQSRKVYLNQNIDQLQILFSLYRHYQNRLADIYPRSMELRIILLMAIYEVPILYVMKNKFNELLKLYMETLGITDLSGFFDSRLKRAMDENSNFHHFEQQLNLFRSRNLQPNLHYGK